MNTVVKTKRSVDSRRYALQKMCLAIALVAGLDVVVAGTFYDSPDSPAGKFVWTGVGILLFVAVVLYIIDLSKAKLDDMPIQDPRFR